MYEFFLPLFVVVNLYAAGTVGSAVAFPFKFSISSSLAAVFSHTVSPLLPLPFLQIYISSLLFVYFSTLWLVPSSHSWLYESAWNCTLKKFYISTQTRRLKKRNRTEEFVFWIWTEIRIFIATYKYSKSSRAKWARMETLSRAEIAARESVVCRRFFFRLSLTLNSNKVKAEDVLQLRCWWWWRDDNDSVCSQQTAAACLGANWNLIIFKVITKLQLPGCMAWRTLAMFAECWRNFACTKKYLAYCDFGDKKIFIEEISSEKKFKNQWWMEKIPRFEDSDLCDDGFIYTSLMERSEGKVK